MLIKLLRLLLFLAITGFSTLGSTLPEFIHFQGRVTTNGVPFTGTAAFKFALVRTNTAMVPETLWSHDGSSVGGSEPSSAVTVSVSRGLYSLGLGDTSVPGMSVPLSPSVFSNAPIWIRVWFDDGVHGSELLTPDQPLGSVGYAFWAAAVPDGAISSNQLAPDALQADRMRGVVKPSNLPGDVAYKSTDLLGLSNQLAQRFTVSLQELTAQLATFSNQLANPPDFPGQTFASPDSSDPQLVVRGYRPFYQLPAPDWVNGSTTGEPDARYDFGGAWTGNSFLIWGGNLGGINNFSHSGSSYSPETDSWTALGDTDRPEARARPLTAWTGSEFIVWGGYGSSGYLGNGKRYRPSSGQWFGMNVTGAPSPRDRAVAGWTGSRFLVWSGRNSGGVPSNGFSYDPSSDSWSLLPSLNQPSPRYGAACAFTTNQLFVWGGTPMGTAGPGTGAILGFDSNGIPTGWTPISGTGAPRARVGHSLVWTGNKLLIWGGQDDSSVPLGDGGCYDPESQLWLPIATYKAPAARTYHSAVWTGTEMVVFGGESVSGTLSDGAAYDPVAGRWRPLLNGGTPQSRSHSLGVWTSREILVFGGISAGTPIHALQRVVPASPWTLYRKP